MKYQTLNSCCVEDLGVRTKISMCLSIEKTAINFILTQNLKNCGLNALDLELDPRDTGQGHLSPQSG